MKNVTVRTNHPPRAVFLIPTILPIAKGATIAGIPNVVPDPDGVRRRVDLLKEYKGKYFAQLAFAGLLAWLGNPEVVLNRNSIVLKSVPTSRAGPSRTSPYPLTPQGSFLINWPHEDYLKSFRHLSFYALFRARQREGDLLYNLKLMDQSGYLSVRR